MKLILFLLIYFTDTNPNPSNKFADSTLNCTSSKPTSEQLENQEKVSKYGD